MKKVFLSGPFGASEEWLLLADALNFEGMEVWSSQWMAPRAGGDWTEEILSAIKRCDVFIAVLQKANSNVMFELGYALGGGKNVLLIRNSHGEIPFDVDSIPALCTDSFDQRFISEVVEWIKRAAIKPRGPLQEFRIAHDMLRHMCDDESFLEELEPREFENCVAKVFQEKGFQAHLMPTRNDKGFDVEIIRFRADARAIIEVRKKNRNSKFSVAEVQRVLGSATAVGADCAIIVTAGGFTSSAKFFAKDSPIHIELLTIDELVDLSQEDLIRRCSVD